MAQSKSCPACGAPLNVENRFAKVVTCEFCDHVILIHDKGLDPTGRTSKLVELPSMLYIDATGTLEGRPFEVKGRLRYQSDSAYWDEWFVVFDNGDQPGWLVEDEGSFALFNKQTLTGSVPPFESVSVGSSISVGGRKAFISEKGIAQIAGSEGQLAFSVMPGEQIKYLDGSSNQDLVSVEYAENEIDFSIGRTINRADLIVEEEDW